MIAYPKPIKKKLSLAQKAKLGLIQRTIPEEKKKALERDNHQCISCGICDGLDFHHVAYHNAERVHDETRNLFYRGVTLCRSCHATLPRNKHLDEYCRLYMWAKHPEVYYSRGSIGYGIDKYIKE